jgi:NTP pyrophosphatase (non-canonical NTP hydrolase)
MKDDDTTLAELMALVKEFRDQRDWEQFHTPKNLSMSIAIEAAELMEELQWLTSEESRRLREDEEKLVRLGEELADIVIYALSFANSLDLDVSTAVRDKLAKNARKYPEDEYRGRFRAITPGRREGR